LYLKLAEKLPETGCGISLKIKIQEQARGIMSSNCNTTTCFILHKNLPSPKIALVLSFLL
jgi:hypothetical protein